MVTISYVVILDFFKKRKGQSRPLVCFFRPFLVTISIIEIEKSLDGVLGIRTQSRTYGSANPYSLPVAPTLVWAHSGQSIPGGTLVEEQTQSLCLGMCNRYRHFLPISKGSTQPYSLRIAPTWLLKSFHQKAACANAEKKDVKMSNQT